MGDRIGVTEAEDMGDLSALAPQAPTPSPAQQRPEPGFFQRLVTPSPWEGRLVDSMFGQPDGDVAAMADQPPSPVAPPMPRGPSSLPPAARQAWNDGEARARQGRIDTMAKAQLLPSKAPKGPMLEGQMDTPSRPGTNPKTALPLYFAKAMGYAVPGESGDEEEARFAKAAHQALLKMTKGMTVAKFLASHQSPKTRDTFGKYLDAELRKSQQPAPQNGKTTPATEPVSMMARPPLQPGG